MACCGHGAVTEPEVGPGPPPKPQEEETVEISPKGVIEEAKAKDVEEMPPSPTSPTSQEKRQQFGSRVVSSCSLQGIHIDEDGGGVKIDGGRLRSSTTHSLTVQSVTSTKSIVEIISDFFRGSSRPDFNGEWICIATWGLDEFLKEMGISYMKRLAASRAPWPSWEFKQEQTRTSSVSATTPCWETSGKSLLQMALRIPPWMGTSRHWSVQLQRSRTFP